MTTRPAGESAPSLATVPELRLGATAVALLALVPVAQAAHVGVDRALVTAAVVTALVAATLPARHALLLALTAWGLLTGFVVNSDAQLTFGPHDVAHLVVLLGVAAVAAGLRVTAEHAASTGRVRSRRVPDPLTALTGGRAPAPGRGHR